METSPSLREYLALLWRRKWYIALVTTVVLASGLFYAFLQVPVYETSAEVLVLPVNLSSTQSSAQEGFVNMVNEVQVATSIGVRRLAAQQLQASGQNMGSVSVDTPISSELLTIKATSPNPASAQATANAYAQAYLDFRRNDVLESLQAASEPVKRQLKSVNGEILKTQRQILRTNGDAGQTSLQIRLNSLFTQRSFLQQKLNDLILPENLRVGEPLQSATLPAAPSSPNYYRTAAFALFVGLSLGVGIAFLRERLDQRVRDRDALEAQVRAPVLGLIPKIGSGLSRPKPPLPTIRQPRSPAADAFRALRVSVSALISGRGVTNLVITSPRRGEGATAVAANLGVALARSGRRVTLISDDLRGAAFQGFFHLPDDAPRPDVRTARISVQDALSTTPVQNLRILHSGFAHSDDEVPMEAGEMRTLLSELSIAGDIVLIDAAPILEEPETLALALLAEGVLLVANASRTRGSSVLEARRRLDQVGAEVLGAVLVNCDGAVKHARHRHRSTTSRRGGTSDRGDPRRKEVDDGPDGIDGVASPPPAQRPLRFESDTPPS